MSQLKHISFGGISLQIPAEIGSQNEREVGVAASYLPF